MSIQYINSILRLFNLSIDNNYVLNDFNNNTKNQLLMVDCYYLYEFSIKDILYKVIIGKDSIVVENSSRENFIFKLNNFTYKKVDGKGNELEQVIISPKLLSFYNKNDLGDNTSYSINFVINMNGNKFIHGSILEIFDMKDKQRIETIISRYKDQTTFINVNNKIYTGKYTSDYSIKNSSKDMDINDYLESELCRSGFINTLLDYLRELIPDFDNYIVSINKNVLRIKNDNLIKKISTQ